MPQPPLFVACGLLVACASSAPLVRSVPVDDTNEDARLWAAVLSRPLTADPPTLSEAVRQSLVAPTELVAAHAQGPEDSTLLATRILPLALEPSMHPVLVDAAERLRSGDAPADVLEATVAEMRERRITCRAYRGVLFGGHPGRDAARDENAFIALEIVYFHLRGHEDGAPPDPIDCGNEAPTALLRPQLVPYLAVAAGAEPTEVRASVAALLEAMH